MAYVGGLRARLLRESLYRMINDSLTALDWFNPARKHLPLTFVPDEVKDHEAIAPNTAALTDLIINNEEAEMGSNLTDERYTFYVDFYGENDAIALHFTRDIADLLRGKMASIGRSRPSFDVYDFQMATPSVIFNCQIENIVEDRPSFYDRPFKHFWRTVRFEVVDTYGDESG